MRDLGLCHGLKESDEGLEGTRELAKDIYKDITKLQEVVRITDLVWHPQRTRGDLASSQRRSGGRKCRGEVVKPASVSSTHSLQFTRAYKALS